MNRYYQLQNEGGEGYTPRRQESVEPLIWQLRGQRDRIQSIMSGTSSADPRYTELERELAEVKTAITEEEQN